MRTVLITGAGGFIGRHLCSHLVSTGWRVHAAVRSTVLQAQERVDYHWYPGLSCDTDWRPLLDGIEAVVHLAARVHVRRETEADPLTAFRTVNVTGSEALARQCGEAEVKRFVFLSSIGAAVAAGEHGNAQQATPYQRSKREAELRLEEVARETNLELVILRPPLVYGPDAPGNFALLRTALERGFPLPFGALHNRRSLLYVENLVDAIRVCLEHEAAPGHIFELSDGEPISTTELVRCLAKASGQRVLLFSLPTVALHLACHLSRKLTTIGALMGDLVTDDRAIRERLGWRPPFTLDEGLYETVTEGHGRDAQRG